MEFSLLGAAAMGVAGLWLTVRFLDRDGSLTHDAPAAFDRLLGAAMVGLATGRLWAILEAGTNPFAHPLDLFLIRAGVDTLGATLGATVALVWSNRRRLPRALDASAAPVAAGLAGWHAGCLVRGACLGTPTDLPWAVTAGAVGRHPVEVYAAVGLVVVAVVAATLWRRALPGTATWFGVAGIAGVRLLTEPLRLHLGGGRVGFYALGLAFGVIGLVASQARQRSGAPQPKTDQHGDELAEDEHDPEHHQERRRREP